MTMTAEAHNATPHVLPLKVYLGVAAALLILTGVTVGVSFIHFGAWNMVVAMTIAGIKMILVALIFMHLKYDNKLYCAIFAIAIVFLLIFIIFTLFDTLDRGAIYEEKARPIKAEASIYDSLQNNSHLSQDSIDVGDSAQAPADH